MRKLDYAVSLDALLFLLGKERAEVEAEGKKTCRAVYQLAQYVADERLQEVRASLSVGEAISFERRRILCRVTLAEG
jgi:hypothetical protein